MKQDNILLWFLSLHLAVLLSVSTKHGKSRIPISTQKHNGMYVFLKLWSSL